MSVEETNKLEHFNFPKNGILKARKNYTSHNQHKNESITTN